VKLWIWGRGVTLAVDAPVEVEVEEVEPELAVEPEPEVDEEPVEPLIELDDPPLPEGVEPEVELLAEPPAPAPALLDLETLLPLVETFWGSAGVWPSRSATPVPAFEPGLVFAFFLVWSLVGSCAPV
jgi:hypothetical protein